MLDEFEIKRPDQVEYTGEQAAIVPQEKPAAEISEPSPLAVEQSKGPPPPPAPPGDKGSIETELDSMPTGAGIPSEMARAENDVRTILSLSGIESGPTRVHAVLRAAASDLDASMRFQNDLIAAQQKQKENQAKK